MENNAENKVVQYLAFKLGNEIYAVEIFRVREILDFPVLTKIPGTPEFMRGVINLRGKAIPIADLRLKFGMSKTEKSVNTCIVVVEVELEGSVTIIGALADSVQEVVEIDSNNVEPPPKFGTNLDVKFIKGMGKVDEKFLMILDIDKVFSSDEISLANDVATLSDA